MIASRQQPHRSHEKLSTAGVDDLGSMQLQHRVGLGWHNVLLLRWLLGPLLLRNHIALGSRRGISLSHTPLIRVSMCRVPEFTVGRLLNIVRLRKTLVSGLRIAVVLLGLILWIVVLLAMNGRLGLVVGITLVGITVILAVTVLVHAITHDSTGGSSD